MKSILCYGDSNTWGAAPLKTFGTANRYGLQTRWTGVMREELGDGYWVIEEGLNGRTTVFDDPVEGAHKNGRTYLLPCLETHAPLDLVIIMLGTNDLKSRFSKSPFDIAAGAGRLLEIILSNGVRNQVTPPETVLVCPAPLGRLTLFADMFEGGDTKSVNLARHYEAVARDRGSHFINAGDIISSSDTDGIHLDPDQHEILGRHLSRTAHRILTE